jgi:hypothetical protein
LSFPGSRVKPRALAVEHLAFDPGSPGHLPVKPLLVANFSVSLVGQGRIAVLPLNWNQKAYQPLQP